MLSVNNLTVLELDLCGTSLVPRQEHHDDFHVCKSIGALLGTLSRLCLRTRSICADVLRSRCEYTKLPLSEVLINLNLDEESRPSAVHSRLYGPPGAGYLHLYATIESQAEALVSRMASPRIMRILTSSRWKLHSFDVLTGKRMTLANGMAWQDDGRSAKDDSDSEYDSQDGSSSEFESLDDWPFMSSDE